MSHFYDKKGNPCYTVPKADGTGKRDTNIRDAKKLKLLPSVTTLTSIIAQPGLENWKQRQVLDAAYDLKNHEFESGKSHWISIVQDRATKITRESSARGTEIHDKLDREISAAIGHKDMTEDTDFPILSPVLQFVYENFGLHSSLVSERSFAHFTGFAGKVDLHGKDFILDFKTKDSDDFSKIEQYDSHKLQLAAYRLGLQMPKAKCFNLFISTKQPGLFKLMEVSEEDLVKAERMFICLLEYWKLEKNYDPSFTAESANVI